MIPINTVHILFSKRGTTDYSLNAITSGDFIDPSRPSMGVSNTSESHTLLSFPTVIKKRQKLFTTVEENDIALWVDPTDLPVIPKESDTITHITEGTYTINQIRVFKDQGGTYLYVFQLRQ